MARPIILVLMVCAGAALITHSLQPPDSSARVDDRLRPKVASLPADSPSTTPVGNGMAGFTIERAPDSHFYADAQVNGARARFMIDTGATSVVLTKADAQRAGIAFSEFSAKGLGAGGEVKLMPATISRLAVGPLVAHNVPAMIAAEGLPISLLGQSYLERVGTVEIKAGRMVLR